MATKSNPLAAIPKVQVEYFVPTGGVDQVTPPLRMPNGYLRDALNVECGLDGGYSRIAGYEPHQDAYILADLQLQTMGMDLSTSIAPFDTIVGELSRAEALLVANDAATTYGQPPYDGYGNAVFGAYGPTNYVVANVRGNFVVGERLFATRASPPTVSIGTVTALPVPPVGDGTPKGDAAAYQAVYNQVRKKQSSTPGRLFTGVDSQALTVGPVVGVFVYRDVTYVFIQKRNQYSGVGTGFLGMYRCFGEGNPFNFPGLWQEVSFFPADVPAINAHVEVSIYNFSGSTDTEKAYIVTGTYKAMIFDGSSITLIATGMADDRPRHVCAHRNMLFLSFLGSVQFSTVGDPTSWSVSVGTAGEIAVGDTVTGMLSITGSSADPALLITTERSTWVLYGSSSADFVLTPFSMSIGAYPGTLQNIGTMPLAMNAEGIVSLSTTQKFGGFEMASLSHKIRPFLSDRRNRTVASMVVRNKNQYRIFFDDGSAVYCTFGAGKLLGMTFIDLKLKPSSCWSSVKTDGTEVLIMGDDVGNVYRLDHSTAFDGRPYASYARMAFNQLKSPRVRKAFKLAIVETQCESYCEYWVNFELGYGTPDIDTAPDVVVEGPTSNEGLNWDTRGGFWDRRWWDGRDQSPARVRLTGTADNISMLWQTYSDISGPYNISGLLIHYILRRLDR